MCEDSRSEKRYWMRRVDELRQQMEREERERQSRMAAPPGTATGSVDPVPLPVARAGWRLGSIVAGAVVALSILLFSVMSPAATFVYVSNADDGDIGMYTLQSDGSLRPGRLKRIEQEEQR